MLINPYVQLIKNNNKLTKEFKHEWFVQDSKHLSTKWHHIQQIPATPKKHTIFHRDFQMFCNAY